MKRTVVLTTFLSLTFALALVSSALAYSTERTGLTLTAFDRNQGKYAYCGGYHIYATDKELLMFDSLGTLQKTYTVPTGTGTTYFRTDIVAVNSTHLIVLASYRNTAYQTLITAVMVKISTLYVTTLIGDVNQSGATSNYGMTDQVLAKTSNGNIYGVVTSRGTEVKTWVKQLYPTVSSVGNTAAYVLYDQSVWIPSHDTPESTIYTITKDDLDASGNSRYDIWKINLASATFTYIGTNGYDWYYTDTYVYLVGSRFYDEWYEVLLFMTLPHYVDHEVGVNVIKFNDTAIGIGTEEMMLFAPDSATNLVRPLSVSWPTAMLNDTDITDGIYSMIYAGASYYLYKQDIMIDLEGAYRAQQYGVPTGYENKRHYYIASNSIGGYQEPHASAIIELDYQNSKAVGDGITVLSLTWGYSFTFKYGSNTITPAGDGVYYLTKNLNYRYSFLLTSNNNTDVYGTGILYLDGRNSLSLTMSASRGSFNIMLPTEGFVNFTLVLQSTNYDLEDGYVVQHTIGGITGSPGGIPGTPTGGTGGQLGYTVIDLIVPFMCLAVPSLMFAAAAGMPGLFIGLILGVVVLGIASAIPMWAIVMLGIGILVGLVLWRS